MLEVAGLRWKAMTFKIDMSSTSGIGSECGACWWESVWKKKENRVKSSMSFMDHGSKIHEVATCCNKPLSTPVSYTKSLTSEGTLKLSLWMRLYPQISALSHPQLRTKPTGQFRTSSGGSTRRFQFVSSNLSWCVSMTWDKLSITSRMTNLFLLHCCLHKVKSIQIHSILTILQNQ